MMTMRIPFYTLEPQHGAIRQEIAAAVSALVDKGEFILGTQTQQFEEELAAWFGMTRSVGVGNGSDALYTSLIASGVGPGDEVIVPAHTCVATWVAASRTGAALVPVDAHPSTWLIDLDKIVAAITPKTRAIIPVHLYGLPCEMSPLMQVAQEKKLLVIEDNAQAMGASYNGQKTGTFGSCNALSFYPTKTLGALGDGGAIVTDDERMWRRAVSFRNYGSVRNGDIEVPGINSRLDEMQASILRIKLRHMAKWNEQRRTIADWYNTQLADLPSVERPVVVSGGDPVYHIYAIAVANRDQLRDYLAAKGVGTGVHYPLAPLRQEAYKTSGIKGVFPVADRLAQSQVSLPAWPGMTVDDVSSVCELIRKFLSKPASTR